MKKPDDPARLHHMLDAGCSALRFAKNATFESLEDNLELVYALLKAVEIVGEAAANVSKPTRDKYPQIPWAQIVAMRNRLIHAYFDVDREQVWKAVTEDIPPLIAELERIIADEEG